MQQTMSGNQVTPERIMQMVFGYAPPLIIEAAVNNRVFDVLDEGPKTVEEVSAGTGASVRGLRAVMNALVGLDFLAKDDAGRYSLTPESAAFLVSGKPAFFGGLLRHSSEQLMPNWLRLREVVRTGKPAFPCNQEEPGTRFFEEFVESLFPFSYPGAQALATSLDGSGARGPISVLDVAAGSGAWGIAIARHFPRARVTAVDWPGVIPTARRVAERMGVADRVSFVAGDLMEAGFGGGYDVAVLGHILHSEGEERGRALIAKVFDALAPGGRIAVADWLVNEDRSGPPHALIFAVNMLVNSDHGDTFSFDEIRGWLEQAGFREVCSLDAPGPSPLIIATKPGG